MRTFPAALVALVLLAAPAEAATRNFGITSFSKIRVTGPFKVAVSTSVAPFAKASGSRAALDRLALEVRGDTLVVQSNPSWGGFPGSDPGPIEISIGTHELSSASLMGAGSLTIDRTHGFSFALSVQGSGSGVIASADSDQLSVSLDGSANARIGGRTGKLTVLARGISSLDAGTLTAQNAALSADGTATIDATVTGTARVDAWGPATVRLGGRPACDVKVTGSAAISGCKSAQ
jgi:hypothetical protein